MKYKCDVTQNISNNDVWTHMVQFSTRQQNIKDPSGWCDGRAKVLLQFKCVYLCRIVSICNILQEIGAFESQVALGLYCSGRV